MGRPQTGLSTKVQAVPESLPDLWAWRRELLPRLNNTPYIEEETPVVCVWYPTAQSVIIWNLSPQRQHLTLCGGSERRSISVEGLDVELVEGVQV